MPNSKKRSIHKTARGQNQAEFAAIFGVFILFILVPLIDMAAVPIRSGFADSAVKDVVHNLALSSKFSQAQTTLSSASVLQPRLNAISGVSLLSSKLSLSGSNAKGASPLFTSPGSIPQDWLPDGKDGPYHYSLVLSCDLEVSPLFALGSGMGVDVPGLTGPFRTTMTESYAWENLSKDPETQQFFLNE